MSASVEPKPPELGHGGAAPAEPDSPARRPRLRTVVLAVVVLAAVGGLVVVRLQLLDPYRSGTVHHETTQLNGCDIPGGLYLDGRVWSSHDHLPANWPNGWGTQHDVGGILEVTATDEATFTADIGGSVQYHRLAPNALGDLDCPIK